MNLSLKKSADNPDKSKNQFFTGERKKKMYAHIMQNNNLEITKPIRTVVYAQEVKWKGRLWAVVPERIITDAKGINHIYLDVNDSAVLTFSKDHADACKKCGAKMTVDAKQNKQMNRKKIITSLWGVDNTHIMLLLIMGIIMLVLAVIIMYLYGDNTSTHAVLEKYLKPVPEVLPK